MRPAVDSFQQKRVLVVSLDSDLSFLYGKLIEKAFPGTAVCFARTLGEAFEQITTRSPLNLILADKDLNHFSGMDLAPLFLHSPVPIIIVTKSWIDLSIYEAFGVPMTSLQMPFGAEDLKNAYKGLEEGS